MILIKIISEQELKSHKIIYYWMNMVKILIIIKITCANNFTLLKPQFLNNDIICINYVIFIL